MPAFKYQLNNCEACGQPKPTLVKPPAILDQAALAEPVERLKQVVLDDTKYDGGNQNASP